MKTINHWIESGYKEFAEFGPGALKIEVLAKKIGISKSSFYHHFADVALFTEHLLKYHLQQSKRIAKKEQQAKTIDPDLIAILMEHKIDLLFNRQLRINREQKTFATTLQQSDQLIGNAFAWVWMKDLGVKLSDKQLAGIFELGLENFYLQINAQNLNPQWLHEYFVNLKRIVRNFI
jgi:AcrR family transcriptional regulator